MVLKRKVSKPFIFISHKCCEVRLVSRDPGIVHGKSLAFTLQPGPTLNDFWYNDITTTCCARLHLKTYYYPKLSWLHSLQYDIEIVDYQKRSIERLQWQRNNPRSWEITTVALRMIHLHQAERRRRTISKPRSLLTERLHWQWAVYGFVDSLHPFIHMNSDY